MTSINSPAQFYAHSRNEKGEWHLLKEHLENVARIAKSFARRENELEQMIFEYAGLLHDAGKYSLAFQDYLKNGGRRGSVPHAIFGSVIGYKRACQNAVAFAVDGHHRGLRDWAELKLRIKAIQDEEGARIKQIEDSFFSEHTMILDLEKRIPKEHQFQKNKDYDSEFFVRYVFSVLTDADWLDTESHFDSKVAAFRKSNVLDASRVICELEEHFKSLNGQGDINNLRNHVRKEVVTHVSKAVGFYSLNVPTGLGKTLTSFYWALKHAEVNGLRRIIIVLPYVNIIDQTARVLKGIFGDEIVLEHHSGIIDEQVGDDEIEKYNSRKLATENWDYPVVVTTSVQFFESLFSNKPSKCRKLHNISDSVVIFDEVQTLRHELILPTLEILKQVNKVLKTSFLFCTATQPAFEKRDGFNGFDEIVPLIENPAELFKRTERVNYRIVESFEKITIDALCGYICSTNKPTLVVLGQSLF